MLSKIRKCAKHPKQPNAFKYEVLVHWKGYDDVTWEPLENILSDVPDMVEDFLIDRFGISSEQLESYANGKDGETYYVIPTSSSKHCKSRKSSQQTP